MKQVILKSVYSRLAPSGSANSFISNRRLSQHQAQTYKLLKDRNLDVIFCTALTGDGKSLSAYLAALRDNCCTMGLYPTNELSRDQESQIENYVAQLSLTQQKQRVCRLSSEQLTDYALASGVSRQSELLRQIQEREILLTNPDIYHLIMNNYYLRRSDARDKVFSALIKNFELTVFDEFHIFGAPQIVSVVNSMLLTRATHGEGRKFLFLSATPSTQLREHLERVGLSYAIVKGEYCHALAAEVDEINLDEYRRITHQITLFVDVINRPDKTAEQWLIENVELDFIHFDL